MSQPLSMPQTHKYPIKNDCIYTTVTFLYHLCWKAGGRKDAKEKEKLAEKSRENLERSERGMGD